MLVNIKFNQEKINQIVADTQNENPNINFSKWYDMNNFCKKVTEGIYLTGLNFNHKINLFSNNKVKDDLYSFSPKDLEELRNWDENIFIRENYGICDNYEQVLKKYPELLSSDRRFILSLCSIKKKNQPSEDGWRWHKWGNYIGTQEPKAEYIYDEPKIEEVFVYHIYEVE